MDSRFRGNDGRHGVNDTPAVRHDGRRAGRPSHCETPVLQRQITWCFLSSFESFALFAFTYCVFLRVLRVLRDPSAFSAFVFFHRRGAEDAEKEKDQWIPTFAGMTVDGRDARPTARRPSHWIHHNNLSFPSSSSRSSRSLSMSFFAFTIFLFFYAIAAHVLHLCVQLHSLWWKNAGVSVHHCYCKSVSSSLARALSSSLRSFSSALPSRRTASVGSLR